MRRLGRALCAGLPALLLAACGGAEGPPERSTRPLVGVILPDTESSARWEEQDRPQLQRALEAEGLEPVIENARNDEFRFASIADDLIARGVAVLLITPLTPEGGATVVHKARKAGIPVIDYDRFSVGGAADYHVSFDNEAVGELQARGLVTCLGDRPGARVIELQGAPQDNNAVQFADGQRRVLGPRYERGDYRLAASTSADRWDPLLGRARFEQALNDSGGRVDGVLAANDRLAAAAIQVLRARGLAGKVPVTGQDATVDGLRAVLRGEQCMTVHKSVRDEAEAAARLASALADGDSARADALASAVTEDPANGRSVKAVLLGAVPVHRDGVALLVASGVVRAEELCAPDLERVCAELGIAPR
ncbi:MULTISPECIES: sugar ABC transporter substrate-binding protein [Actinosynnema]|uniref:sugar ABC transporter substrate-binding protein n=1 Tax=Actinosynnema TaxID=40566 RepID=UPI0020A5C8BD|nr:substrate-binding domain-containing protein [Actinosynnema pretiosum]MCP2092838.1 monosaccharide ABC transporter substrate-binding protein, CUT2 family [Actinosynnema pretiosum]